MRPPSASPPAGLPVLRWLCVLLVPAALLFATAPAARASCNPTQHARGIHNWNYVNCSMADVDQERTPGPHGGGGLPNSGLDYCVPTSAMDTMVWLSKWGFIPTIPGPLPIPTPPNKDWTAPANFNQMTTLLRTMGKFMGTNATTGTNGDGLVDGVNAWLALNAIRGRTTRVPVVTKFFQSISTYDADPNAMGLDAASGALVMVSLGFYDSDGNRTGGHEVVLQRGKSNGHGNIVIHVMDPNDPKALDHVQSPYSPEEWNIFASSSNSGWSVNTSETGHTDYGIQTFDGYAAIEPEYVLSADAPAMIVDQPFALTESVRHSRQARRFKLPGGQPVVDFAVAPEGFAEPYLQAGSDEVREVNTLDGAITKFAAGPAQPRHLTYGGPAQTLFVSGTKQIVALDRSGRRLASVALEHPLDALAFDARTGRLVGLSAAQHRVYYFSTALESLGSAPVPAAMLAGRGVAVSLAIAPTGALVIHRDGSPSVAIGRPAVATTTGGSSFREVKLAGVEQARGLAVDDRGHMFFSARGRLVELLANGQPVAGSVFDGMPAAAVVHVARSYSNAPAGVRFQ
jgi:hypothetical protein